MLVAGRMQLARAALRPRARLQLPQRLPAAAADRHRGTTGTATDRRVTTQRARLSESPAYSSPSLPLPRWFSVAAVDPPSATAIRHSHSQARSSDEGHSVNDDQDTTRTPLTVTNCVVSRPMSWSEVSRTVSARDWRRLGRLREVQEAYAAHRQQVMSEWATIGDFMRWKIFNVHRQKESDGKYRAPDDPVGITTGAIAAAATDTHTHTDSGSQPTANSRTRAPSAVWTPNSFPYGTDSSIHHDLFWSRDGDLDDRTLAAAVEARLPQAQFDTVYFVNPVENRSVKVSPRFRSSRVLSSSGVNYLPASWLLLSLVPHAITLLQDIYHAHIFWRRRPSNTPSQDDSHLPSYTSVELPFPLPTLMSHNSTHR